jgi:hypothetical protein
VFNLLGAPEGGKVTLYAEGHTPQHVFKWVVRYKQEQVRLSDLTLIDTFIKADGGTTNTVSLARQFDSLGEADAFCAAWTGEIPLKSEQIDATLDQTEGPFTIDGSKAKIGSLLPPSNTIDGSDVNTNPKA